MPPQRFTAPPIKIMKTERTHEENQERAYIAASRRSDRSLEARVESARRASEIHKKRTGRALRVTEQDVINEEMYEEEDDGLPLSYRRLTAHLQTGSADFNRRLAAYLANQVAMRSAVDHMVHNQYAAAFPNAPQYAHNNPNSFDNPFLNNFFPQQPNQEQAQTQQASSPAQQTQQLPSPQETRSPQSSQVSSPTSFRSTPYPPPQSLKNTHVRSQSIAAATSTRPSPSSNIADPRRLSMPVAQRQSSSPVQVKVEPIQQQATPQMPPQHFVPDTGPLTTTLPAESQMFFGAGFGLDPNDNFSNMLMGGSAQNVPWTSYNFDSNPSKNHPSYNGLSATLAPSDLDKSSTVTSNQMGSGFDMPAWNFRLDPSALKTQGSNDFSESVPRQMVSTEGLMTPGQITPGENMWESFLESGTWDEPSSTTTG